jgi:hypothetical protein
VTRPGVFAGLVFLRQRSAVSPYSYQNYTMGLMCKYLSSVGSRHRQAAYRSSPHVQTWPVDERAANPVS